MGDDTSSSSLPKFDPKLAASGGKWSAQEDARLRSVVKEHGAKNWKVISKIAFDGTRSDVQCLHRWQKVLRPGLVKGPWLQQEDDVILELIKKHGVGGIKWSEIAARLPGRLGKQCRERYVNHLDPELKKSPWTEEEDRVLMQQQTVLGNKWREIAACLPGRSENAVKNRFNSQKRKRKRTEAILADAKLGKKQTKEKKVSKKAGKRKPQKISKKKAKSFMDQFATPNRPKVNGPLGFLANSLPNAMKSTFMTAPSTTNNVTFDNRIGSPPFGDLDMFFHQNKQHQIQFPNFLRKDHTTQQQQSQQQQQQQQQQLQQPHQPFPSFGALSPVFLQGGLGETVGFLGNLMPQFHKAEEKSHNSEMKREYSTSSATTKGSGTLADAFAVTEAFLQLASPPGPELDIKKDLLKTASSSSSSRKTRGSAETKKSGSAKKKSTKKRANASEKSLAASKKKTPAKRKTTNAKKKEESLLANDDITAATTSDDWVEPEEPSLHLDDFLVVGQGLSNKHKQLLREDVGGFEDKSFYKSKSRDLDAEVLGLSTESTDLDEQFELFTFDDLVGEFVDGAN